MKWTKRQYDWKVASDEEAKKGNGFAAGLFALLAQPNEQERKKQEAERDRKAGASE